MSYSDTATLDSVRVRRSLHPARAVGLDLHRERLKNAAKPEGPRLFVYNTCRQFIRTFSVLPRDEVDMDDVDSKAEEHVREDAITP